MSTDTLVRLSEIEWRARRDAHLARVEPWVAARRARRATGDRHPVDDFLFDYYPYSIGRLTTWHPGLGVALEGAVDDYATHPDYRPVPGGVAADPSRVADRLPRLDMTIRLLESTAAREGNYACFGMHEWAMVYDIEPEQVRHASYPLRLQREQIVEVVDDVGLRCTHIDAYRFFTSAAAPLNAGVPTRAGQHEWEQPSCLHANMDLYKYAMWFQAFVPGELVADCFDLARSARELDMRAAPYDLVDLGYQPIRVETAEGRRQYAQEQRRIAGAALPLRQRLHHALDALRRAA